MILRLRSTTFLFAAILGSVLLATNIAVTPSFIEPSEVATALGGWAPFALLGMASAPSIISGRGGIDLSVAPLMSLINILFVTQFLSDTWSSWVAIPALLAIGGLVGLLNGLAVAYLRIPAVIATLCSFFIISGVNLKLAPTPVTAPEHWSEHLAGTVGFVPGALLTVSIPLLIWAVVARTPLQSRIYAVGDRDTAAYTSGIDVRKTRASAYALGGVFAACAGIALTSLVRTADPGLATPYILVALAAVALGGIGLEGGVGSLVGALLGAACIYLISTLMTSLHLPAPWLQVAYGFALVVALTVKRIGPMLIRRETAL